MHVSAIGHGQPHPRADGPTPRNPDSPAASDEGAGAAAPASGDQRGVIRNLQSGHFPGVADVRLRINFAEEIVALDTATAAVATAAADAAFLADVDAAVDALRATEGLDAEQLAAIEAAYGQFLSAITGDAPADPAAAGAVDADEDATSVAEPGTSEPAHLDAAFEALLARLHEVVDPPPPAESETAGPEPSEGSDDGVADGEPAAGAGAGSVSSGDAAGTDAPATEDAAPSGDDGALALEPVDFGKAFAALEAAYEGYSAALSDASTTSALPPLSPPSGTGAAYAKFLAQLEGTSDAASDESVNVTA